MKSFIHLVYSSSSDTKNYFSRRLKSNIKDERGIALFMTVFIVTLATIIVFDLGHSARLDQRISRSFSEGIQAEFTLRSAVNLGQVLLNLPRNVEGNIDSHEEEWHRIGSIPTLPIEGIVGEARLSVIDDTGKLDITAVDTDIYIRNYVENLFQNMGFREESYDAKLHRTPGNQGFKYSDQVAAIIDWQDRDSTPYQNSGFDGKGKESGDSKHIYYNRKLESLNELLLVPGMTAERVARIAPFVKVYKGSSKQVNINTAKPEVLRAMGFPDYELETIVQNLPFNDSQLSLQIGDRTELTGKLTVRSSEFSIIARVLMPSTTRWAHARVTTSGQPPNRRITLKSIQFY